MVHFEGPPSQAAVQERITRFFALLAAERSGEAFDLIALDPWLHGGRSAEEARAALLEGLRAQVEAWRGDGTPARGERWLHRLALGQASVDDLNWSFGDEHDPLGTGDQVLMSPCFDGEPTDVTAKFRVWSAEEWNEVAANAAAAGRVHAQGGAPTGTWVLALEDWHVM